MRIFRKRAGKQNANASYRGSGSDIVGKAGTSGAAGTSGTTGTTGTSGTTGTETGTSTSGMTEGGTARDIDSWAAATLPNVEHHLQMAKDLEKRVKDEGKASKSEKNDK